MMGLSSVETDLLLTGRLAITMTLASKLVEVVGASMEFWMHRDYLYRQEIERVFGTETEWLAELPVGEMIKFGCSNSSPSGGRIGSVSQFF